VDRKVILDSGIYSASEIESANYEHYTDYLWVPKACRYKLFSFADFQACTERKQYNFLVIGSSVERTYWHDLLQFSGIEFNPEKIHDSMQHSNNITRLSFYFYAQLIANCSMKPEDERTLEGLLSVNGSEATTVLIISAGIAEGLNCPRHALLHNLAVLQRVLPLHKSGPVVWISPPAVIDWRMSLLWRVGWSVTGRRMAQFYADWQTATDAFLPVNRKAHSETYLIDSFQMLLSRMDATTDGVHHYSRTQYLLGGPTSKWPMMILANLVCGD
jgi:hypothetical protein